MGCWGMEKRRRGEIKKKVLVVREVFSVRTWGNLMMRVSGLKSIGVLVGILGLFTVFNGSGCSLRQGGKEFWVYAGAIRVSPNGRWVAVGSDDGRLVIIDMWRSPATFRLIDRIDCVSALTFSGDAQYLFVGNGDSTVYMWRTSTWQRLADTLITRFRGIQAMASPPQSDGLICGNGNRELPALQLFRRAPDSLKWYHSLTWFPDQLLMYPSELLFTVDGRHLLIDSYMGDLLRVPVSPDGRFHWSAVSAIYRRESHGMGGMAVSPRGRWLAFSPLTRDSVLIYDCHSRRIIHRIAVGECTPLAFDLHGQRLFMIKNRNQLVSVRCKDWQVEKVIPFPDFSLVYHMHSVPYQSRLVLQGSSHFVLWDYESEQIVLRFNLEDVR